MPPALVTIWLAELARRVSAKQSRRDGRSILTAVEDTPRQRATVLAMLEHISADCSYDKYRNIVWAILSLGWEDSEDIALRWCMTAPHRFDNGSFHSIVSAHDSGRTPSFGTIHHFAREGGYNV